MGKRRAALPSALLDLKRMAELPGRGLRSVRYPCTPRGAPWGRLGFWPSVCVCRVARDTFVPEVMQLGPRKKPDLAF